MAAQVVVQDATDLRARVAAAVMATPEPDRGKCGTAFRMAWRAEQLVGRSGVDGVWDLRPTRQTSRRSLQGHFRIHYDTIGVDTPALLDGVGGRVSGTAHAFADSALAAFERAWEAIVDGLGYAAPPADTSGGGPEYDIYVTDLTAGLFGQTVLESIIPGPAQNERWQTFLEIDNDFAALRTPGIAGLRITAAHEFYHALQVGSYGIWDDAEFYFYELSSVWMETVLEPGIEDYLYDLPQYFANFSGRSLTTITSTYRGYERSIFAMYLDQRFGRDVLREVWAALRGTRVLNALDQALSDRGSSLRNAYREFALWNHRTRDRAAGTATYLRAWRFPRMMTAASIAWSAPSVRFSGAAEPLSHLTFDLRTGSDTLSTVVVNADLASARSGVLAPGMVTVSMATTPTGKGHRVGEYWQTIDVASSDDWFQETVSALRRDAVPMADEGPWPSPWVLSQESDLLLPVGEVPAPESVVFISASSAVTPAERWSLETRQATNVARIPVATMRDRLSSGVYVVMLRKGSEQTLWKVAVIR
jgi:hypothetical protein